MPRGGGGRPRRSKRISAEANSAPSPPGEHGGDDDPDAAAAADAAAPPAAARAVFVPRPLARFRRQYVRLVACGARHTLLYCCATRGRSAVYGWGRNRSAQAAEYCAMSG